MEQRPSKTPWEAVSISNSSKRPRCATPPPEISWLLTYPPLTGPHKRAFVASSLAEKVVHFQSRNNPLKCKNKINFTYITSKTKWTLCFCPLLCDPSFITTVQHPRPDPPTSAQLARSSRLQREHHGVSAAQRGGEGGDAAQRLGHEGRHDRTHAQAAAAHLAQRREPLVRIRIRVRVRVIGLGLGLGLANPNPN